MSILFSWCIRDKPYLDHRPAGEIRVEREIEPGTPPCAQARTVVHARGRPKYPRDEEVVDELGETTVSGPREYRVHGGEIPRALLGRKSIHARDLAHSGIRKGVGVQYRGDGVVPDRRGKTAVEVYDAGREEVVGIEIAMGEDEGQMGEAGAGAAECRLQARRELGVLVREYLRVRTQGEVTLGPEPAVDSGDLRGEPRLRETEENTERRLGYMPVALGLGREDLTEERIAEALLLVEISLLDAPLPQHARDRKPGFDEDFIEIRLAAYQRLRADAQIRMRSPVHRHVAVDPGLHEGVGLAIDMQRGGWCGHR